MGYIWKIKFASHQCEYLCCRSLSKLNITKFCRVADSNSKWISWNSLNFTSFSSYIAGASLISGIVTYPFNVLTIRRQAGGVLTGDVCANSNSGTGLKHAIGSIGWKGLFRGAIMSNAISIPSNIVYLSVTESSREVILSSLHTAFPSLHPAYTDIIQTTASGCMANFSYMLISNPTNVVLAKLVTQKVGNNLNFWQVAKSIYKHSGFSGFTHGFGSNFAYGASTSAIWWWLYSTTRRYYTDNADQIEGYVGEGMSDISLDATAGLVSGVGATLLLHPLDTIVSKIMSGAVKKLSFFGALQEVLAHPGGMRMLWKGLAPSVAGSAMSSSLFAVSYELIKRSSKLADDE